jgi:hypothetical protein
MPVFDVMDEHGDQAADGRLGRAILRGVMIGVPVALIGLTIAVWLISDQDIFVSFATALLPGILLGAFGGGFAGMTSSMTE